MWCRVAINPLAAVGRRGFEFTINSFNGGVEMDEAKKRQLVDYSREGCTLEGSPTTVAGLRNDEASLAPHFGGFWRVSWEVSEC